MELIDRYLKSVRSCLPEAQRDDIINELSENIRSQIEDKEAELGRSLREPEVEAILKEHGHPLIVASRYRQDQSSFAFGRQWIGPVLFPFYIRVLSFNLGLTAIVLVTIFVALFASGQSVALVSTVPTFLYQFLIQFTIVTIIFAVADRHWTQHPDRWEARKLTPIWHPAFAIQADPKAKSGSSDARRVSRFDSIAQFVALGISVLWLRVARQAPFLIFGPAAAFLRPAPVWHQFYAPVVLLALAGMVQAGINLFRPDWVRLRLIYRVVGDAAWLVIWFLVFRAGQWVVLAETPGALGNHRTVEINKSIYYTLLGVGIVAAINLILHLRRLFRRPQSPVPPPL